MNIRNLFSLSLLLAATVGFARDSAQSELKLDLLPNEAWWGGAVTLGTKMPYGVAPWRVLDAAHLAAVKQAVALRMRLTPRILDLAQASAASGEPILRPLAYGFPAGGYENVKDQFLMGDALLVAPMVTKGAARTVQIPSGKWKADDGTLITGPIQQTFAVPLGRLLYFERQYRP